MDEEKRKTVKFNEASLAKLPDNKPAVYKIFNQEGDNVYTGVAKCGRVEERLKEHLPGGTDPIPGGAKVQIQQKSSIADAQKTEAAVIARSKPQHNKQGK